MKTDKQKLIDLLNDFGIKFREESRTITINVDRDSKDSKVSGYSGFFTEFEFDKNGKFEDMGVWE
jgi:hypothetical protein